MTSFYKLFYLISLVFILLLGSESPARAAGPSLKFSPDNVSTPNNAPFTISILVDTSGYASGGVGTIINFDPFMVTAISIETGKIFADYPLSAINNNQGKITISGIASSSEHLFTGSGEFATITFKPNQLGSSDISFSYQPGSTTDSNIAVTFGNGDVLSQVNKLTLTINPPTTQQVIPTSDNFFTALKDVSFSIIKQNFNQVIASLRIPYFSDKYASIRAGRPVSKKLSALDPIVSQPPITDPFSAQPIAAINSIVTSSAHLLQLGLIAIIFLSLFGASLIVYKLYTQKVLS